MNLLQKKIADLTTADLKELAKAIGTTDLPYPSMRYAINESGVLESEMGVISDDNHPLVIYSDRPHDYVVGEFFRRMSIPSLLPAGEKVIAARAPDSKSRVMMIRGKPGTGKSEIIKMIADISDRRGAEVIDCGGQYVGDLLWEQTIDYGEDFKTAMTNRIRSGLLTEASVKIFEEQFPDALIKDNNGKTSDILWDKIAVPRNKGTTEDPKFESIAEAAERSIKLIENTIAKYEGIPSQTVNSVGMKKVPGVIKRLHDEGRIGLLDEYLRSVDGSDDSLQTLLQYLNGEIDEFTTTNSMKTGGREETYSYTLRRSEMKLGFCLPMTGNSEDDGMSCHGLSKSAYSRIPVFTIDEPLPIDWRHRISQVITGLPLSTLYSVFSDAAKEDPKEFAEMLVDIRLMGLTSAQQAKIPPYQLSMLGGKTKKEDGTVVYNWEKTLKAVEKLADFYIYWARIVDPRSDFFEPQDGMQSNRERQNLANNIMTEISLTYRDEIAIDFRKIIQVVNEATKLKPEVKRIERGLGLRLNFNAVGRQVTTPSHLAEQISSEIGSRLEAVILERIGATTVDRPQLRAALVKEATDRGIIKSKMSTAKNETIADLLNQDAMASFGGTKAILKLRESLVTWLKQKNPSLSCKSNDEIMSIDRAISASDELQDFTSKRRDSLNNQIITLGNNVKQLFNVSQAVDGVVTETAPLANELVSTTDFLESLKIPAIANMNMHGIWTNTISTQNLIEPSEETTPVVKLAEGAHECGIGITTLAMQSADGKGIVPVHVVADEDRQKKLLVVDAVTPSLCSALAPDIAVVSYNDAHAEDKVNAFIKSCLEVASRKPVMEILEQQLTYAFVLRAGNESEIQPLARMMTNRKTPAEAPVYIVSNFG